MAYQIKKSEQITEELEFLDENNEVALKICVDIDAGKIAATYRATEIKMMEYSRRAKSGDENALEAYSAAIVAFFGLIFGEEDTARMIDYFEGNYTDMFIQTAPFIQDVIKPAIMHSVQQKRQMMASNMDLNRKQRRKLGL